MLYKNCRELPIHNFNECMEGNLSYLVVSGEHTDDELESKWVDILDEYNALTKTGVDTNIIKRCEIVSLQLQIDLIVELSTLSNVEEFQKYTQNKDRLIAGLTNKLNRKIKELPKNTDKNDFDKTLAVLNSNGFTIDRFKTPVSEYVKMLELLDEKIKAMREHQSKR